MAEPPTSERSSIFISHATPEDNHFVRWLGAKLTAMGYEVWADVMRLKGGSDWSRILEDALRKKACKMLLVCTANGVEKPGVRAEIEMATIVARALGDDSFIIPLRLENYEAPFRIATAQYIDFKRSWATGFLELSELLQEIKVPRGQPGAMQTWLESHADGSDHLQDRPEPLVSNWLQVRQLPKEVRYIEAPVGIKLSDFQNRDLHKWPVAAHRAGVLTFAALDEQRKGENTPPCQLAGTRPTSDFLDTGWEEIGIPPLQARRMMADLGTRAFENFCRSRGLKSYGGSGGRANWWGDIKTLPLNKVKFDWPFRRGLRQIVGQSEKRAIHWHYAVNGQFRTGPIQHLRLSPRLVFSSNGLDAIDDVKRNHQLRRSFAKGWRNARWRDMLCAYIWWLADGTSEIAIAVGPMEHIVVTVPPMQFGCPVSVPEGDEAAADEDEDDPDVPTDNFSEESSGEQAEGE